MIWLPKKTLIELIVENTSNDHGLLLGNRHYKVTRILTHDKRSNCNAEDDPRAQKTQLLQISGLM